MIILWLLNISHEHGIRHGANLRYINFSKGLVALGHQVFYVIFNKSSDDQVRRNEYLETLKKENCISGYFEIRQYSYPPLRGKLSRLATHPRIQNLLLRSALASYKSDMQNLIAQVSADVCIISQRSCLPLLPDLGHTTATIIDWCDSSVLAGIREMRRLLRSGKLWETPSTIKELFHSTIEETFYGRWSDGNILVSGMDKSCLDRLNGRSQLNYVLHNGVESSSEEIPAVLKAPNRLIFSGTMSFPPNSNAALWFIERVMPLLMRKNKNIRLVVAGQEPTRELLSKASGHVTITGFLPDIRLEIAKSQLYVAPLISGTGFKNKIVEAIASGTYVIGTPWAVEFLEPDLRNLLLTAGTAEEFVILIETFLSNPRAFDDRLGKAQTIVRDKYQWTSRVKELEWLCGQAKERHVRRRRSSLLKPGLRQ
jgi:glycosyltransferase involved in cell wall biosynthesis